MIKSTSTSPEAKLLRSAGLTDKQMRCAALYFWDGLPEREIAEQMDISGPAVHKHIKVAKRKMAAVGLRPQKLVSDFRPKMIAMDPHQIDSLGPEDVKAVW